MIASKLLSATPKILYGFGSLTEPVPATLKTAWDHRPQWKQVHGIAFAEITKPQQVCGDVDAMWTQTPGLPIAVATADCVPILLCKKDGSKAAVIHAGWRGTLAKIVDTLWNHFASSGESPLDWNAVIGPCISGTQYQVTESMIADFQKIL